MNLSSFFKKCVAAGAVFAALSAGAADFAEGTDYVKLDTPIPNSDGIVTKVYSYDCPFCYKYDKAVTKAVMDKLPEMKFEPMHLATKGKYGVQASEILAVLMTKDEMAGTSWLDDKSLFKKAKFAYYKAYHDKKLFRDKGLEAEFAKTGLEAAGVTQADIDAMKNDPKVQEKLTRWGLDNASGYAYGVAKIQGVPAFVVDGKYLIKTAAIKGIDQMAELVKYLHSLK